VILFDVGALIAFERRTDFMRAIVREAMLQKRTMLIPTAVLAQVWRKPAEQVLLRSLAYSRFTELVPLDAVLSEAIGVLCARTQTRDIVDASVALIAKRRAATVFTSDPQDIARLDKGLRIVAV
jgi:hypothetical protein